MSDDNTRDGAEPSPASAGSVGEVLAKGIADIIRIATEPEWISVKERLPDDDVQCLVWHKNGRECRVAVRWKGEFWEGSIRITSNVTHWTSLPAPPSDGK